MAYVIEQLRLYMAETLIRWAVIIAPVGSDESLTIYHAAHCVFKEGIDRG